jgi:hypothetical protein
MMAISQSLRDKRKGYRLTEEAYRQVSWTEDNPCYCSACSMPPCGSCENGCSEEIAYEIDEMWEIDPDYEEEEMTPFEKAGYTKDTKFKVLRDFFIFTEGEIISLRRDDGTSMPFFWKEDESDFFAIYFEDEINRGIMEVVTETKDGSPKPKSDGWIEWSGGEMPVPEGTRVHTKYRDGGEAIVKAGTYDTNCLLDSGRVALSWTHSGGSGDIITYKLYKEPDQKELTKSGRPCSETVVECSSPIQKIHEEWKTKQVINQEEEVIMSRRRVVKVLLIDNDKGLDVKDAVVAQFDDVVTEDDDGTTIREILINNPGIAEDIAQHNLKRADQVDLEILNRTGNEVKLRPIKLKDLDWVVQ